MRARINRVSPRHGVAIVEAPDGGTIRIDLADLPANTTLDHSLCGTEIAFDIEGEPGNRRAVNVKLTGN